MTKYRLRKLGRALKRKDAIVVGKACTGARWPEGDHMWIVEDIEEQATYHVPVDMRPSWAKYCPDPEHY